jgi:hypothetical protein
MCDTCSCAFLLFSLSVHPHAYTCIIPLCSVLAQAAFGRESPRSQSQRIPAGLPLWWLRAAVVRRVGARNAPGRFVSSSLQLLCPQLPETTAAAAALAPTRKAAWSWLPSFSGIQHFPCSGSYPLLFCCCDATLSAHYKHITCITYITSLPY